MLQPTKPPARAVAIIFEVWGTTPKQAHFFPDSWFHRYKICYYHKALATSIYNFFLSLVNQELPPSHLKGALYGFFSACPNCQHHYSCAVGALFSTIGLLEHKHPDTLPADLTAERAAEWLTGKQRIQCGYTGQGGDSHPGQDEVGQHEILSRHPEHCTASNVWPVYFWIVYVIVSAGSWPRVTEIVKSNTTDNRGLLYFLFLSTHHGFLRLHLEGVFPAYSTTVYKLGPGLPHPLSLPSRLCNHSFSCEVWIQALRFMFPLGTFPQFQGSFCLELSLLLYRKFLIINGSFIN